MQKGKLIQFDQTEFIEAWPLEYTGLANEGFVYFPDQCTDGQTKCKIMVFLHGGNQSYKRSNFRVVKNSGFGDYAPNNNLIILFPQVDESVFTNPLGCWDFGGWGVSDW